MFFFFLSKNNYFVVGFHEEKDAVAILMYIQFQSKTIVLRLIDLVIISSEKVISKIRTFSSENLFLGYLTYEPKQHF